MSPCPWPKTFADCGFRVKGGSLAKLFARAGEKLSQLQAKKIIGQEEKNIKLTAATVSDLLYRFLSELLFFKDKDQFLGQKFEIIINKKGEQQYQLEAVIKGGKLPQDPKLLLADVKAVTYHQLAVKKSSSGWQAQVIVDV